MRTDSPICRNIQNGTDPFVADAETVSLPVFLITGAGNALRHSGHQLSRTRHRPASHPAEQAGGMRFHNGTGWSTSQPLSAARSRDRLRPLALGQRIARLRHRQEPPPPAAATRSGTKAAPTTPPIRRCVATATAAAANPPAGIDESQLPRAALHPGRAKRQQPKPMRPTPGSRHLLENLKHRPAERLHPAGILGEIGGSGTDRDTTRARHAVARRRPRRHRPRPRHRH